MADMVVSPDTDLTDLLQMEIEMTDLEAAVHTMAARSKALADASERREGRIDAMLAEIDIAIARIMSEPTVR